MITKDAGAYVAAVERAIVVPRSDRGVVRVFGRDPVKMVHGLVTNDVQSLDVGRARYAVMLNVKGRMLADVRVIRRAADLLIEAHTDALIHVRETLKKFVPPLFAKSEDMSGAFSIIGVYGPASHAIITSVLSGPPSSAGASRGEVAAGSSLPATLAEDDAALASFAGEAVHVLRTREAGGPGFDIIAAASQADTLMARLEAVGAVRTGRDTLEVLRIEAGRPRWGAELAEDVIPLEAGLLDRAISTTKGCYTGQEVIIRILHRGHVNRHLRGLRFGARVPPPGTELFRAGDPKPLGRITSACWSPRHERAIALGYVRREVQPGEALRTGSPAGDEAEVVELPFHTAP